ncbi:MAG: Holliday junction branch migration protein RuvA [Lachnospiraceae bacterium]|nr:Holliday junction branch migration protein RuvA [Lachnospiraceae bacterium]
MISYIRGDVLFRNESSVVIDVNGIGYEVFVPYPVLCAMEKAQGSQVELYTYLQVKEDGVALFGFADRQDLATFKYLITVNGIGPKGALGIMSYMSTKDLMLAVLAEDAKAIAKAPGIGAKTASKLIIELKDKFKLEDTFDGGISAADLGTVQAKAGAASEPDDLTEIKNEAVQALTALGYSSSEALKAVRSVPAEDGMTVEKLLKAALKYI